MFLISAEAWFLSGLIPEAGEHSAHIGKAGNDPGHRVFGKDFVLKVDEAFVVNCDEGFENPADWHDAFAYGDLILLAVEVGEIFHVAIEKTWSRLADGLDDIGAGPYGVAYVDATTHGRIQVFDRVENS